MSEIRNVRWPLLSAPRTLKRFVRKTEPEPPPLALDSLADVWLVLASLPDLPAQPNPPPPTVTER